MNHKRDHFLLFLAALTFLVVLSTACNRQRPSSENSEAPEKAPRSVCVHDGGTYSEGARVRREGRMMVCRAGEWVPADQ